MKNQILGKVSPKHILEIKELFSRFEAVELHLEPNDVFDESEMAAKQITKAHEFIDVPIFHAPMTNQKGQYVMIGMLDEQKRKSFREVVIATLDLIQATRGQKETYMVVHPGENINADQIEQIDRQKIHDIFKDDLNYMLDYIDKQHLNVHLCIENLTILSVEDNGAFYRTYGFDTELIKWVEDFNHPMVGLTLDICHLMSTCRYPLHYEPEAYRVTNLYIALNEFIASPALKMIHLANCHYFGLNKDEHGCCFDSNDMEDIFFLNRFLEAASKVPHVKITLELNEKNHAYPINKVNTYKLICRICDEKSIN